MKLWSNISVIWPLSENRFLWIFYTSENNYISWKLAPNLYRIGKFDSHNSSHSISWMTVCRHVFNVSL
jgi:hypothetical protein